MEQIKLKLMFAQEVLVNDFISFWNTGHCATIIHCTTTTFNVAPPSKFKFVYCYQLEAELEWLLACSRAFTDTQVSTADLTHFTTTQKLRDSQHWRSESMIKIALQGDCGAAGATVGLRLRSSCCSYWHSSQGIHFCMSRWWAILGPPLAVPKEPAPGEKCKCKCCTTLINKSLCSDPYQ